MKLLLDLGNTRLKWALCDGGAPGPMHAVALDEPLVLPHADAAWLASSTRDPARLVAVEAALSAAGVSRIHKVGPPADGDGLRLAYTEPATLGVDRWLMLRAALAIAPGDAVLVVGVGTALTIDGLAADGRHLGGLIAPGPRAMREALLLRAPHLVDGGRLVDWASNTRDAVQSGALLACAALIERQHVGLASRLGSAPRLLIAGGDAALLGEALRVEYRQVDDLVLRGLALLAAASTGAA